MAWIERRRRKDGSISYWVRDIRDGKQICIPAETEAMAEAKKAAYEIRRDLEKEGYDDKYHERS